MSQVCRIGLDIAKELGLDTYNCENYIGYASIGEAEEYLATIPAILESVVLARTNDAGDQTITAIVVPNEEVLGDKNKDEIYAEIKAAVNNINRKLPSFKQIRKIEVRTERFERTTSKKIQRFKVN